MSTVRWGRNHMVKIQYALQHRRTGQFWTDSAAFGDSDDPQEAETFRDEDAAAAQCEEHPDYRVVAVIVRIDVVERA